MDWIKTFILATVLALIISVFIRPTLVKGNSMDPSFYNNDYLLINEIPYTLMEPERGDVVIFKTFIMTSTGKVKNLIKRVIGVSGDLVEIRNGKTYVNGEEINENYIKDNYVGKDLKIRVPADKIFVMGDNREISLDSRKLGPIKKDKIKGKVFFRIYPFNKLGIIK
ncbi:signal peptidase I [Anaeromicrobium sediminis]|uniref:Signal peptidase I n=1 Tax=Anaeromicrobium sediminis TaxID=1478221 RepID=A0A267MPE2_9FIRM|nr:signal peptidase I [Anaeromicrobium sediminis]PAB61416.1 signal peptidase I [Anaeromicrobium sediminis]